MSRLYRWRTKSKHCGHQEKSWWVVYLFGVCSSILYFLMLFVLFSQQQLEFISWKCWLKLWRFLAPSTLKLPSGQSANNCKSSKFHLGTSRPCLFLWPWENPVLLYVKRDSAPQSQLRIEPQICGFIWNRASFMSNVAAAMIHGSPRPQSPSPS